MKSGILLIASASLILASCAQKSDVPTIQTYWRISFQAYCKRLDILL